MKVSELIKKLGAFPGDATVCAHSGPPDRDWWEVDLKPGMIDLDDNIVWMDIAE